MTRHILLDTSPMVAHMRRKINLAEALPEGCLLFTSLFTVGELEKGINKADYPDKERARVNLIMKNVAVIVPDQATAEIYGRISQDLDSKGNRIPENDTWIAAVALEGRMTLATGDAHFNRVDGLDVLHLAAGKPRFFFLTPWGVLSIHLFPAVSALSQNHQIPDYLSRPRYLLEY